MKGTTKRANKKKLKGTGSAKSSKRANLHSWNHAYNIQRKSRTRLRRVQATLPGTPQGKHIKSADCHCGGCSTAIPA